MKRAFLVLGPESTGGRLLTRILVEAGCSGGHRPDLTQRYDTEMPTEDLAVIHRSYPHGRSQPKVPALVRDLRARGYHAQALVMVRDWWSVAASQVAAGHSPSMEAAWEKIRTAYVLLYSQFSETRLYAQMVVYEALILHPRPTLERLGATLGLALPLDAEIRDENAKWAGRAGDAPAGGLAPGYTLV